MKFALVLPLALPLTAGFAQVRGPQDHAQQTAETILTAEPGEVFFQPVDSDQLRPVPEHEVVDLHRVTALALDPLPGEASGVRIEPDQVYFDERTDAIWAMGATYKASVASGGFTYVPFLGSNAPRNFPVRFRLLGATLDGRALALPDEGRIERRGDRLLIRRGPIEVRYDVAAESVEQSFAIDAGALDGSLELEIEVTSELGPRTLGEGLSFDGPHGGVRYGAATVFDDKGHSAHVPMALRGTRLRLEVPASFLREARGKVVVDPLINTYAIDRSPRERRTPDIAYDLSSNQFLHVFEERFSGSDTDIMAVSVDPSTGAVRSRVYVDATSQHWTGPQVANLNHANVSVIVAMQHGSPIRVMGRTFQHTGPQAANAPVGPPFVVSQSIGSTDFVAVDIGGNSTTAPNAKCMVVWNTRDAMGLFQVFGRTVSATGSRGSVLQLTHGSEYRVSSVTISESTGVASTFNRWNVACSLRVPNNTQRGVGILQLNANAQVVTPLRYVPMANSSYWSGMALDVSDSIRTHGRDVFAVAIRVYDGDVNPVFHVQLYEGSTRLSSTEYMTSLHQPTERTHAPFKVSTTGSDFLVARTRRTASYSTAVVTCFDVTSNFQIAVSEREALLDPGYAATDIHHVPALASRFSGGMYSSRYTGASWNVSVAGSIYIQGATHFASSPYSCGEQYCFSEPNGTGELGFVRLTGSASAATVKSLRGESLPPGVLSLAVVGNGFSNYANPNGPGNMCVGGVTGYHIGHLRTVSSNGTVQFPIDPRNLPRGSGSVVGLAGQRWQMTIWHRNVLWGAFATNYTNAVSVLLD